MTMRFLYLTLSLALTVLLPAHAGQVDRAEFSDLLNEAGLGFSQPRDFRSIETRPSGLFPYEHAIRRDDKLLEVRYAIRPLSRIEINYEDPHNAAPEPNHVFTMMFTALIGQLSKGGSSPHREYRAEDARQKYNADWAALSVFDIEPEYSADYSQAFLVALHKNNLSDAYLVILFNDYQQIKPLLDEAMLSLRFK